VAVVSGSAAPADRARKTQLTEAAAPHAEATATTAAPLEVTSRPPQHHTEEVLKAATTIAPVVLKHEESAHEVEDAHEDLHKAKRAVSALRAALGLPEHAVTAANSTEHHEALRHAPLSGLVSVDSSFSARAAGLAENSPPSKPSQPEAAKVQQPLIRAQPVYHHQEETQGWFSSLWSWITGSQPAASTTVAPTAAAADHVSFLGTAAAGARSTRSPRDDLRQRTAEDAMEEMSQPVLIGDAFSELETEDAGVEDSIRSWDHGLKVMTETRPAPAKPAPGHGSDPMDNNGVSEAGSFWGTMASEDAELEASLNENTKDLSKYEKITHLQNAQVASASEAMKADVGAVAPEQRLLHRKQDPAIQASLTSAFSDLEQADAEEVDRIKKSPYLRMMQLREKHRKLRS